MATNLAGLAGDVVRVASPLGDIASALNKVVELQGLIEQERTKRAEILAKRDVAVAMILAERQVIQDYFERVFRERSEILTQFYMLLAQGNKEADEEMLKIALTSILEVVKTSPFVDFNEFTKARREGISIEL